MVDDQPLTDAERQLPPHLGGLPIMATACAIALALVWAICGATSNATGVFSAPSPCGRGWWCGNRRRLWLTRLIRILAIQAAPSFIVGGMCLVFGIKVANMNQFPRVANTSAPANTRLRRFLSTYYATVRSVRLVLCVSSKTQIMTAIVGFITVNVVNTF